MSENQPDFEQVLRTQPKPCPFCRPVDGSGPDSAAAGFNHVHCLGCNCRGPYAPTPEAAIAAWNQRAGDAVLAHVTEQRDSAHALIGNIQAIVSGAGGPDNRDGDWDVLDSSVSRIVRERDAALARLSRALIYSRVRDDVDDAARKDGAA